MGACLKVRAIYTLLDGQGGGDVAFSVVDTSERRRASCEEVVRTSEHGPDHAVVHELASGGLEPTVGGVREVRQRARGSDFGQEDSRNPTESVAPPLGRGVP